MSQKPNLIKEGHIPILNLLRGVAASMVCFYHFFCEIDGLAISKHIKSVFSWGDKGVHLFFIISGIVIPMSMIKNSYQLKKWGSFIMKRLIRIDPPYIISILLFLFFFWGRQFIPGLSPTQYDFSFTGFFLHLGYLVPFFDDYTWISPVYWTLAIEFQYYIVIMLLIPLLISKKLLVRLLSYMILLIPGIFLVNTAFLPTWTPVFLIGIAFSLHHYRLISVLEYIIIGITCLVMIYVFHGYEIFTVVMVSILVIHFFTRYTNTIGEFLGRISYSLYLTHLLIGTSIINLSLHFITDGKLQIAIVIVAYLCSVVFAYFFYRLFEKRFQQLSKKEFF